MSDDVTDFCIFSLMHELPILNNIIVVVDYINYVCVLPLRDVWCRGIKGCGRRIQI
jgi:hypothetical protein